MADEVGGTPHVMLKTLSPRARQALLNKGITTLEEACRLSDAELTALPGLKASSLAHLRKWQEDGELGDSRRPAETAREARRWDLFKLAKARGLDDAAATASAAASLEAYYAGEGGA